MSVVFGRINQDNTVQACWINDSVEHTQRNIRKNVSRYQTLLGYQECRTPQDVLKMISTRVAQPSVDNLIQEIYEQKGFLDIPTKDNCFYFLCEIVQ